MRTFILPLDTLITFFSIALLLPLTLGLDNLFVLMRSAIWGRKAGLLVVLGLCTGLLGHTATVVVGLAAVFAASPAAFTVLKLAGAAYLLYLAWQILRALGPSAGPMAWQIVELGAVFMAATLLVFGTIAFFSGAFGQMLQRSAIAQRWLNRLAGVVFVGLALRLATASR